MNKKGITPLMATVLLVTFALALGVVVMNFGRAQVELEAECPIEIGMHFALIGGEEDICYDSSTGRVRFTVENGVNIKIEGLVVNVIGTSRAETYQLDDARISRAGTYVGNAAYSLTDAGDIRQVKISPKVQLQDNIEICVEKALVVENVQPC